MNAQRQYDHLTNLFAWWSKSFKFCMSTSSYSLLRICWHVKTFRSSLRSQTTSLSFWSVECLSCISFIINNEETFKAFDRKLLLTYFPLQQLSLGFLLLPRQANRSECQQQQRRNNTDTLKKKTNEVTQLIIIRNAYSVDSKFSSDYSHYVSFIRIFEHSYVDFV